MTDPEFIGCVRDLRRLVATMDSLGYAINKVCDEDEIKQLIQPELQTQIVAAAGLIHDFLQAIELSKKYKDINRNALVKGNGEQK